MRPSARASPRASGIEVPIEPRRVMVFKPSNVLKARINGLEPGEAG